MLDTLTFLDSALLGPWIEEWGDSILSDVGAKSRDNDHKQVRRGLGGWWRAGSGGFTK
jgi:hypothetical protein